MKAAGLKAIDTVVESTAVLVKSRSTKNPLVDLITSRISGVISTSPLLRLNCNFAYGRSLQPLKDTSCASTTSFAPGSRLPRRLPPASGRPQSPLWRRRAGWLSAPWWRKRRLRRSWTSCSKSAHRTFWSSTLPTRERVRGFLFFFVYSFLDFYAARDL
jgi:hypothetical protein